MLYTLSYDVTSYGSRYLDGTFHKNNLRESALETSQAAICGVCRSDVYQLESTNAALHRKQRAEHAISGFFRAASSRERL